MHVTLGETQGTMTLRLLVAHQLVGSVIGKSGSKIREIQEESGAKIVVSKDMLPQSTERIVEVFGVVDSIHLAVYHIGKALLNDLDRGQGVILYDPQQGGSMGVIGTLTRIGPDGSLCSLRSFRPSVTSRSPAMHRRHEAPTDDSVSDLADLMTKNLNIHSDMVGCVIGRGGSFITHIRRTSGARLHVSEQQGSASERTVTIVGSENSVNKALSMLYTQLENEKERRESVAKEHADQKENLQVEAQ